MPFLLQTKVLQAFNSLMEGFFKKFLEVLHMNKALIASALEQVCHGHVNRPGRPLSTNSDRSLLCACREITQHFESARQKHLIALSGSAKFGST